MKKFVLPTVLLTVTEAAILMEDTVDTVTVDTDMDRMKTTTTMRTITTMETITTTLQAHLLHPLLLRRVRE